MKGALSVFLIFALLLLPVAPAAADDDELFGMNLQPHLEWVYPLVFDGMNRLGAAWIRTQTHWNLLEPKPGRYRWKTLDGLLKNAAKRKLGLLIVIRTARSRDDASNFPADLKQYGDFIRALAQRYSGRKVAWQIEDKPDLAESWRGTAEQYVQLLQTAHRAAHEADAGVVILNAGLAGPFPHFGPLPLEQRLKENRRWFEAILKSRAYDAVDLHDYFPPEKNAWGITFEEYLLLHKQWMKDQGVEVPVWISEAGINSKPVTLDGKRIEFSEMDQAKGLYAIYTSARAHGVTHLFWCKVIDTADKMSGSAFMGLSHPNRKAKPAGDVYKKLSKFGRVDY
ncbi:MAG: beta-galactosidase [Candidatus Omnitrophica bacterium]|nr:beta-galactosidase [Candidatus Omnitrophota bacterium]